MGVLLCLGQHLDGAEDGQAGADESKKLLVENQERLELDLAAGETLEAAAHPDGKNMVAGVGEAGAQLIGSRGGLHLLLYAAAFIGQFDDEFCHAFSVPGRRGPGPGVLYKSF